VATALSQLGVKCMFFTALGKDEFGDKLIALLEERGVDLSGIMRVDQATRWAHLPFLHLTYQPTHPSNLDFS
jgi:sugar/nucleoside kinase (ribokinase family)